MRSLLSRFPIPRWCYLCHRFITREKSSDSFCLCGQCFESLPFFNPESCPYCGLDHSSSLCEQDWAQEVSGFFSIFNYDDPIRSWTISLKYSRNLIAGRILQQFIKTWFQEYEDQLQDLDCVIPIPLHSRRLRRRGFNQAHYLLNKQTQLPISSRLISKTKATAHQAGLSREERLLNVQNSFELQQTVKGKRILLFDDVCTTGQTLGEVTRCFMEAGAAEVHILVLCRALGGY